MSEQQVLIMTLNRT